jgi:hypothetical protein
MYVEPSLHPWDEADLFMVNDHSAMLLNSICHYFIEDWAYSSLSLYVSLFSFGMSEILAS